MQKQLYSSLFILALLTILLGSTISPAQAAGPTVLNAIPLQGGGLKLIIDTGGAIPPIIVYVNGRSVPTTCWPAEANIMTCKVGNGVFQGGESGQVCLGGGQCIGFSIPDKPEHDNCKPDRKTSMTVTNPCPE